MDRTVIRTIIAKTPRSLRDQVNRRFPDQTSRLRGALAQLERVRGIEDRLRSLERAAHGAAHAPTGIRAWECSIYSQNGEDGILMHLFSRIGGNSFRFLEFGCGNAVESNSTNLLLGFGWGGLLIDWDQLNVEKARQFLGASLGRDVGRVRIRRELVTPDNVNDLIKEAAADASELDLLSIDVDGNDYWIWEAVDGAPARVVVAEYNPTFGPERSVTVEFDREFDRTIKHPSQYYHGASLEALRRLGASRGYQLVGCDATGSNAFFVRTDVGAGLPSLTSSEAYVPSRERAATTVADQFNVISHLPLVDV